MWSTQAHFVCVQTGLRIARWSHSPICHICNLSKGVLFPVHSACLNQKNYCNRVIKIITKVIETSSPLRPGVGEVQLLSGIK